MPMMPPMSSSVARIWVGCLKIVTSTQGAKVMNNCLREP